MSSLLTQLQYHIDFRFFPRAERTINSGQTIKYYRNQGSDIYTFKYKAEATGKVTVSLHISGEVI